MKHMFHRFVSICLALLCLSGLPVSVANVFSPPAYAAQKAQAGKDYIVNVRGLNLRSGPSVKDKVITVLKKGTKVTYVKSKKGWWYVEYPKGSGYVDGKFLRKKDSASGDMDTDSTDATHRTICRLNMRDKPSLKGRIVGVLRKGAHVSVISQKGDWSKIKKGDKTVWVATRYLKEKK